LSEETYSKQVARHQEIRPAFYAVVPTLLRDGEVFEQAKGKVQFIWEVGCFGYEATVKATRRGELFLVSFFRAKRSRTEKTRRTYRRVN